MAKKSKLNLINDDLTWSADRRYKVNSVASLNGEDYQNITGKNSSPDLLIDWQKSESITVDQTIIDGSTNAVSGNAVSDGLALKANLSGGNSFTGNQQITGNISATGLAKISGNVVGGGFIKTGAPATNLLVADGSDIPQSTFALASSTHNPVTIGTANGLSLSTQVLSLGLASSGVTGALSGTDWNTFNGKANANGSNASGTWGISISGNAATSSVSNSLNPQAGTDANAFGAVASFRLGSNTGGSTNFPTTAGVFFESRRSGPSSSSVGTFQIYSNNLSGDELLYFRKVVSFSGTESWSSWRKIATLNSADRFLLGTTTDNLTDIAQFNGSAIATAWKTSGGASTDYVTGTGSLINFNSGVRTTPLTGFVSGAGTVSATDTVLQAINKLDGNNAGNVKLTGNQTIAGTKTFSSPVIIPNGVNANEAVNKGQLDAVASSGTYTPTVTVPNNLTSISITNAVYTKIGNIVNCTIGFTCNATVANTNSDFRVSLPFNTVPLSPTYNCIVGSGKNISVGERPFSIGGQINAQTYASIAFTSTVTTNVYICSVSFQYSIN